MTDFLVAHYKLQVSNVEANFVEAEEQIELAARRGAELIGLPENFAFLSEDEEKLSQYRLSIKCTNFLKPCHNDIKYFFWEEDFRFCW